MKGKWQNLLRFYRCFWNEATPSTFSMKHPYPNHILMSKFQFKRRLIFACLRIHECYCPGDTCAVTWTFNKRIERIKFQNPYISNHSHYECAQLWSYILTYLIGGGETIRIKKNENVTQFHKKFISLSYGWHVKSPLPYCIYFLHLPHFVHVSPAHTQCILTLTEFNLNQWMDSHIWIEWVM